ncbi:hypothetical protein NEUTE1DRAFT_61568 [Neurospora tetrasperma FGSC 2508]|uniref:Galactose oxidase n=1 Tax=Neurospora tetrasperma (strain FGSC 2508 / ATCC MYA-4615 / P0657) TaxID=510951 RepID=F8MIM1_NEUT8|nr:uncharacterized protein NEUTE1DRAFT_61568 [Neurospora tetrasperma FGSC 2508]EGO59822.1 hypothetical protein NEUTE1DRAFT_61568 [Neurospora tetrasperma FGSC 2508]EGZ73970.1 hypothetical protein NEUTE2DRAFT_87719 [Neurospora tetrasperma FGSC 2509]
MGFSVLAALALAPYFISVQAQSVWEEGQVSTTLCYWEQPRAAIIRDTIYMDGGRTWWIPGMADGTPGALISDDNPYGRIFTLNLSTPFETKDNVTAKFKIKTKAPPGSVVNNNDPNYIDGALLANDAEWFAYGGLLRKTAAFNTEPAKDLVSGYRQYQYGTEKPGFAPGLFKSSLETDSTNVTRYIAFGGAASAPSENLAWYFSGVQTESKGPIYTASANRSTSPTRIVDSLITLDMKEQQNEKWKNSTLPPGISGRANPELVWVPVGAKGILVVLGGVVFPDFISVISGTSENETESKAKSPTFMTTIDVYDVANDRWYSQPTTGDNPGQLTRGCAVVAPAEDQSSFNIYYYGGYKGLKATDDFNDDVWVLSVPSFTWTKITSSTSNGRAGHKCFMPYPDQMFVMGGYTSAPEDGPPDCVIELVRVFNLTSGTWLSGYDPAKHWSYGVPEAIKKKIGGSATGGATARAPSNGWVAADLGKVFDTKYPTKIATWYPYVSEAPVNNTNPTSPGSGDPHEKRSGGVPSWLPPVLGVVLGLMLLTIIVVLVLLWRRRRLLRAGTSVPETEDTNGYRIMSWMRGQQQHATEKAPTVTTSDELSTIPHSPSPMQDLESTGSPMPPPSIAEAMDTQITPPPAPVELMDTSPPAELHDTSLSHIDVLNRHSSVGRINIAGNGSLNNPSYYTGGTQQMDHASNHTRSSMGVASSLPPHMQGVDGAPTNFRPDSELMGSVPSGAAPANRDMPSPTVSPTTTTATRGFALSDVSNVSERDKTHLRQISDATVSSMTSGQTSLNNGLQPSNVKSNHRFSNGPAPSSVPEEHVIDQQGVQQAPDHLPTPQSATFAMGGALSLGSPQPISPPTAGLTEGSEDYMSARPQPPPTAGIGPGVAGGAGATSSPRRSMFTESKEDMNGTGPGGAGR